MLTVALSKGRLLKDFIRFLEQNGNATWADALNQRERKLQITVGSIKFILVKGSDVPTYVEEGIADIGITGSDILKECPEHNINNYLDLPFGQCHFSVAAKSQTTEIQRVATTFVKTTRDYFNQKGTDVTIIRLSGSVELAAVVDMVDAIVDIVQTGTTLKSNGLEERERIGEINARLITNKHAFFSKSQAIENFIQQLGVSIHAQ
ncbi:ATP phosphoribosyltransferase catalytic subunit [Staphylococcus piscifermentans]|uniref:ATP phosphoribosyltransferase n=1 Tax=Staphylococcus piscifermentans TaxID=70258 RepID=A0A239U9U7_9STAP|nr:ATP phosphoribosyltransferase [Staphylococcus piscifermentans]RTX82078.1 ATP phosphoribosyltransferase [Staphylococcus piscifermentans]GEP85292.1 ATP phosphoribosyltransferase [Staphylococcus piscifermentans]SNV06666.1 ATP phosphoribosyltransferase catalytic subunit [Staphylococcus piscifermentans]